MPQIFDNAIDLGASAGLADPVSPVLIVARSDAFSAIASDFSFS